MEKQLANKKYLIEVGLILILLVDLFIKLLPIIPLSLLVLLYVAVRANYWENTFLCFLCYPTTIGFVMNSMGVHGVGGWFTILGFMLLAGGYMTGKIKLHSVQQSIIPLIALFALFVISALITSGGDYAMTKVRSTIIKGSIAFVAYMFLFSNYSKVNVQIIGIDYVLFAALLLRLSLVVNGIPGPAGITDFGFLRNQTRAFALLRVEDFIVDYQNVGFLCVQGVGFFLTQQIKKRGLDETLFFFATGLVVLYLGSRQAIITFVLLIAIWFFQLRRGNGIRNKVVVPTLALIVLFFLVDYLFSEEGMLYSVAEEGFVEGGGRGPWLMSGILQFLENPVFGVGYGRFLMYGEYGSYPHNLFVELLCETGMIGSAIALFLALKPLLSNKNSFVFFLYVFLALFMRSMVSSGLDTNIVVFSLLFALPAYKEAEQREGN